MSAGSGIDRAVGSRIRAKRIEKGIDEKKFSACLGLSLEQLAAFECGQVRVDAKSLWKICRLLDCNLRYFFEPSLSNTKGLILKSQHAIAAE